MNVTTRSGLYADLAVLFRNIVVADFNDQVAATELCGLVAELRIIFRDS